MWRATERKRDCCSVLLVVVVARSAGVAEHNVESDQEPKNIPNSVCPYARLHSAYTSMLCDVWNRWAKKNYAQLILSFYLFNFLLRVILAGTFVLLCAQRTYKSHSHSILNILNCIITVLATLYACKKKREKEGRNSRSTAANSK